MDPAAFSAPAAAADHAAISDAYRPPASEQVHFRSTLWSAISASEPDLSTVRALINLGGQLTAPEWRVLIEHESVDGLRTALEKGLRPDVATMGELLRTPRRPASAMCAVLIDWCRARGIAEDDIRKVECAVAGYGDSDSAQEPQMDR